MKKNRYFENCLGHGVGESFVYLDEELQLGVLKRLEADIAFAEGFGLGIGQHFSSLDENQRHTILKMIYTGMPFAWLFVQSIDQSLKFLPKNIVQEIHEQVERNTLFANGIGIGLGYVY